MVNERVEQMKRQQFISLDSQFIKYPSELCFGIINATEDLYLLNSKVAFLKSGQNVAENYPLFLR